MSLPKRNSADGRCYWMKPEVQEELQPLFDQCIQDAIDGRITRLDSLWPPVVVSSEGAPFEVWQLLRTWTEAQRAETLDAEKAIAFSENLRRQSRWGEIDHHLLDMLKRELQEKYFVVTGNEDDHFWDREYSLKPGIRAEEVPEPMPARPSGVPFLSLNIKNLHLHMDERMTSYNYGFGQEPDAKADDPAEDIDFDEMLERIHKETGLCEKVILAVLKAQADYLDDLWGDEEENGEEENA